MAKGVVAMDVRMRVAVTEVPGVTVSAFCAEHGISRQTFYKWRRRYLADGLNGLEPLSRAPGRSPQAMSPAVVEAVIRLRKELDEDIGVDAGVARQLDGTFWVGFHQVDRTVWSPVR